MKHLNENTIQAFLDGELSEVQMASATEHLASCERCTNALVLAESEQVEINFAFAAEKSLGVPTQRIWARIENEIDLLAVQKSATKAETKSFWQNLTAFFTPAQIAFTGSLAGIVLISLFALSVFQQQQNIKDANKVAYQTFQEQPFSSQNINQALTASGRPEASRDETASLPVSNPAPPALINNPNVLKIDYKSAAVRQRVKERKNNLQSAIRNPRSIDSPLLEEKDYLTSIAQLSKAVSSSDELIMRPSFRVEYESNLAMMDKVIAETQKRARQNPNDENAKRALFASYQNKIDLLSTVTEKSQLMATVR